MHPIESTLNHSVTICSCSDGPSTSGDPGLSFGFYRVVVSSEQAGLITLGEAALDNLKVGHLFRDKFRASQLTMVQFSFLVLDAQRRGKGTGDQVVEEEVGKVSEVVGLREICDSRFWFGPRGLNIQICKRVCME